MAPTKLWSVSSSFSWLRTPVFRLLELLGLNTSANYCFFFKIWWLSFCVAELCAFMMQLRCHILFRALLDLYGLDEEPHLVSNLCPTFPLINESRSSIHPWSLVWKKRLIIQQGYSLSSVGQTCFLYAAMQVLFYFPISLAFGWSLEKFK